jgi:Cu2+-exporting ATPase
MAGGAELAQSGADIVLTGTALAPIARLEEHAHALHHTVRQNLGWAIGYNVMAIPLAAAGLIGPGLAALGMSLSSLLVVLNSARLARPQHSTPSAVVATASVRRDPPVAAVTPLVNRDAA